MRQKRLRKAIVQTLRENPQGLTANQIIDRLPKKARTKASNASHISNLIRGMKMVTAQKVMISYTNRQVDGVGAYKVNQYFYDDEGAEI